MALSMTTRDDVSVESRELIDQFLRNRDVTKIQPFLAPGNEAPRHVRELVSLRRKEFRKAQKTAK